MATEFRLPELGENIETGDVVRVAITAGETIREGQTVVELETDKAVIEVPSTVSGVIDEVVVTPSSQVKAGDVLFTYTAQASATKVAEPTKSSSVAPVPAEVRAPVAQAAEPELRATEGNVSIVEFKLPELGENIEFGDVVRMAVTPGEEVTHGPDGARTGDR